MKNWLTDPENPGYAERFGGMSRVPGDSLCDGGAFAPFESPAGEYQLDIAMLDPNSGEPKVKLSIDGRRADGWYELGDIRVAP